MDVAELFSRRPIGYVVDIDGHKIIVNLLEDTRGHVAGHRDGLSKVIQPDEMIGVDAGAELVIVKVTAVSFSEPSRLHHQPDRVDSPEPLRQLSGYIIGAISKSAPTSISSPTNTDTNIHDSQTRFTFEPRRHMPSLGASAYPLTKSEEIAIISPSALDEGQITLGRYTQNISICVSANINDLLGRHIAVLGSTGQGKTSYIAKLLQQLVKLNHPRIIVFDVNGEYSSAFAHLGKDLKVTRIGKSRKRNRVKSENKSSSNQQTINYLQIPYYALGRQGLIRLLMPSERSQLPALRFAIEHMQYIGSDSKGAWACSPDEANNYPVMFDDCVTGIPIDAKKHIDRLKHAENTDTEDVILSDKWPHMRALSCVACEWYVYSAKKTQRDAYRYGHVFPLVNRINSLVFDPRFNDSVNVLGEDKKSKSSTIDQASSAFIEKIFGKSSRKGTSWKLHVVDLSAIATDLMPFILNSILEAFANEIFSKGPGNRYSTLLVLEEAHHYLRQLPSESDGSDYAFAYERLAKEGRKFGLSLMICSQRPSEISSTVLAQCGTWSVFRLTNEEDKRAVIHASESVGDYLSRSLSGLGRGEAITFGVALPVPTRMEAILPDPKPNSQDPNFTEEWGR